MLEKLKTLKQDLEKRADKLSDLHGQGILDGFEAPFLGLSSDCMVVQVNSFR